MSEEEKPRQKINTSRTLEHDFQGKPFFRSVRHVQEFDPWERKWNSRRDLDTVTEQTPLDVGLFRETEILVAFPRSATSEKTLLSMFAYFTQKLKVSVDQGREFKHVWLSLTNGKIFIQWLGPLGKYSGACAQANMSGEPCLVIQRVGKPKRISSERLDALKRSGEISMIFANEKLGEIRLEPKSE